MLLFPYQCFFIDNEMDENFTVGGYNRYHPRMNPLDPTSPRVPAVFEGLTGTYVHIRST